MCKKAAEHKILPLFTFPNGFVLFPICNLLCRARGACGAGHARRARRARRSRTCGACRARGACGAALSRRALRTRWPCRAHAAAHEKGFRQNAAAAFAAAIVFVGIKKTTHNICPLLVNFFSK